MIREELLSIAEEIEKLIGKERLLEELLLGLDIEELEYQLKEIDRYYDLELLKKKIRRKHDKTN